MAKNESASNFRVTHQHGHRMVGRFKDGDYGYVEDAGIQAGQKHVRRISFLERWRDTGVISKAEYAAAQNFEEDYEIAHRGPNFAQNGLYRVDGSLPPDDVVERLWERQKAATERLREALTAVGDRGSYVIVKCVGEGTNINALVSNKDRGMAKGLLIGALSRLVDFYRLA